MISALCASQESDIAVGALIAADALREYVDFTDSFLTIRYSALLRKDRPRRHQPITDARQLYATTDISYGVVQNGAAHAQLSTSVDPLTRSMWTRIATAWPSGFVHSVQEGVDRVRHEQFAFILDSPMAAYIASREPCDLYVTEPFLDAARYAFVVRKDDFRLRLLIDRELRKMKQSEEMQLMYLRWWHDECDDEDDDDDADGMIADSSHRLTADDVDVDADITSRRRYVVGGDIAAKISNGSREITTQVTLTSFIVTVSQFLTNSNSVMI